MKIITKPAMRRRPMSFVGSSLSILVWCFVLLSGVALGQKEVKVGVVLDLQSTFSKISLTSINLSFSDFYANHSNYTTRLSLHLRDSNNDVVAASAAALDLIKNEGVSAIIGPRTSTQAEFMIRLGYKSQVPIISFSATSPFLDSIHSPYFVRATLSDSSQVKAIASVVQSFGWRNIVAVYMDDEFGEGIVPYLVDALQNVDARVAYRSVVSPNTSDDEIVKELYKLMTMQTRVFVVHMPPSLGFRFFSRAKEIGMMEDGYVWILTDAMTHQIRSNGSNNLENVQGVLGVRTYIPLSKGLEEFRSRWRWAFRKQNPEILDAELHVFALWAYDAVTALATAVERAGATSLGFMSDVNGSGNGTDLGDFGVSRYGPTLLRTLSGVRFRGLTGEFDLTKGHLQSSTFEIVNLIGNGERVVGYWTRGNGLVNRLNQRDRVKAMNGSLAPVIWPGETTSVPRGWEIPTYGKKLLVGVPVKRGFQDFIKVTIDPSTNRTTVTGYSKDVFEAVLRQLPYAVVPVYIPFERPDESYNEMMYQVYLGRFDAVAGDVTIRANRSLFVDFTLPYTESGVSMLVPLRNEGDKNTWVFLKPWSWDLWVTSFCFFVFIGFAVWVLEHRVNQDFRGPPHHQIGTSFWFSFSTMVFAQREKVVSNLARFVVIVWCFVVLVLIQSYTASLTSLLTVEKLQPTVTNVNQLIKNGDYVGYQLGSFVLGILKNLGFDETKLIAFKSAEELDELLSRGTSNGGIAAAFDEVPYFKVLLSQYCSKYTMVEPSFKTAGFGFVFPKGSPLTGDVSRKILNVTEGGELRQIESKWFKNQSSCSDTNTSLSSNRLSLRSFWGLFLIAGVASFLALIIFSAMFLHEHRHTWSQLDDPQDSVWTKLKVLFRIFNEKDMKSHMFRKSNDAHSEVAIDASPNTHCPPSPSTSQNSQWPPSPSSPSKALEISFHSEGEERRWC